MSQSTDASEDASITEETKEPRENLLKGDSAKDELFRLEMGFSLVIDAIVAAKVPIIGHNCMYDWLYLYNQFIGQLPETYVEFAQKWNSCFPKTYDTKVLAFNSKHFFKTSLG
jgi:poly(A)-specific ribonuclease